MRQQIPHNMQSQEKPGRRQPRNDSFSYFLEQQLALLPTGAAAQVSVYIHELEKGIQANNQKIEREFKRSSQLLFAMQCYFGNTIEQRVLKAHVHKKMQEAGVIWNLQGVSDIREDFELVLAEDFKKEAAIREIKKLQLQKAQAHAAKLKEASRRRGRNDPNRKKYQFPGRPLGKNKSELKAAKIQSSQPLVKISEDDHQSEDEEYKEASKKRIKYNQNSDDYHNDPDFNGPRNESSGNASQPNREPNDLKPAEEYGFESNHEDQSNSQSKKHYRHPEGVHSNNLLRDEDSELRPNDHYYQDCDLDDSKSEERLEERLRPRRTGKHVNQQPSLSFEDAIFAQMKGDQKDYKVISLDEIHSKPKLKGQCIAFCRPCYYKQFYVQVPKRYYGLERSRSAAKKPKQNAIEDMQRIEVSSSKRKDQILKKALRKCQVGKKNSSLRVLTDHSDIYALSNPTPLSTTTPDPFTTIPPPISSSVLSDLRWPNFSDNPFFINKISFLSWVEVCSDYLRYQQFEQLLFQLI